MLPFEGIGQNYRILELDGSRGWYTRQTSTPSHRFTELTKWFPDNELCCDFVIRDHYSNEHLLEFLDFTDKQVESLSCDTIIAKLVRPREDTAFSVVIYINYKCHNAFKTENPLLHRKTLVAFPAFDCEFSGDETPEQISCLRRDFIPTIDWNRRPFPKVLMRYDNCRTKSKSIGKKMGLTHVDTLLNEIKNLKGASGSFIEIENFLHQKCRVVSKGELNRLSFGDLELSTDDTEKFVLRFVSEGVKKDS